MLPSSAPDSTSSGSSGVQSVQERVQSATSAVRAVVGMQTEAERVSLNRKMDNVRRRYKMLCVINERLMVLLHFTITFFLFVTRCHQLE